MNKRFTKLIAALALLVGLTIPLGMWGQAPVNTVLWGETWTDGGNAQPSAYGFTGTTVYGDATLTYANSSTSTKLYNEALAGGTAPELLLAKNNSTWTITGIPSGSATGLTLSFKANYDRTVVSTTTEGVNVGTKTFSNNTVSYPISVTSSVSSFVLVFTNTYSSNVRIDDIQLVVTTAGGGPQLTSTTTTITAPENFNNDLYVGTSAGTLAASVTETNGGAAVSGATVTWSSTNTDVATVDENGAVTLVAVGSTDIKATFAATATHSGSVGTYPLTVTNTDPNAPGTANNPYTVAQALAANPATGVYVHGIISTITEVSTQHGNATYKISDDGTQSDEMIVYRGKYLNNVAFTSTDQIQVGDMVTVTGNLTVYDNANQLAQGNYLVALERPIPAVAAPVFSPAAGTYLGTQNVTITCETEGSSIYYTTNGSMPTNESTLYNGAITVSETTTIKAIAYVGTDASSVVTATYTIEQPLTTIQAILDVATSTATTHYITFGNWVVTGKNSNGHQAFATDGVNGFVLYNSDDMGFVIGDVLSGTLQCNVQLFGESAEITGLTSTTEGLTVTPNGTVTAVETTIDQLAPINTGSVITLNNVTYNGSALSDGTNTIDPYNTMYEGTFENDKSYNVTGVFFYNSGNKRIMPRSEEDIEEIQPVQIEAIYDYSINGVEGEAFDSYVGATITLATCEDINEDYTFAGWTIDPVNINLLNGTYTITEEVTTFYAVYAKSAQGAPISAFNKVTAITEGQYLIVYEEGNVAFNGGLEAFDAVGNTIEVTINNNTIESNQNTNAAAFTIATMEGGYSVKGTSGKYIGVGSYANGLTTNEEPVANSVSFANDNVLFGITFDGGTMTLKYNKASNQTRFRYYKSGQEDIQLYKLETTTPVTTNYYTIVKFKGVDAYEGEGGYVLVASPVSTTPVAAGMITDDGTDPENLSYDLYSFDQAQELEWINYRQGGFNTIEPGKGYLYANKNDVTLTFAGEPSTTSSATLSLSGNGDFAGWNLVGNPFSVPAYIGTRAYYRIGNGGADIVAATAGTAIDVMEGIFVIANENNEVLNFSTTAAKGASVAMNVVRERGNVIDRAIVRFDEGDQLPKFQLNPNNTKLYIAQGNKDYAVVRSAAQGEMPVSFRAAENGTYTLSIETENVEMDYLHLIDNMTGMDVDLLATPNYTFEAKTSDYASRFRLVFSANGIDEQSAETFAFFNGSEWVVSNTGEATLQVVDVMGRVLSTETISGNAELSLNQPAGVYMLRLINGNDVKVQKVIVK